jgi:hypothetical protein
MTNQHRATPDEWAQQEDWANRSVFSYSSCIIELRARIEALEVGQQPPQDKLDRLIALDRDDPANSLVERVADAIAAQATSAGIVNDLPARAAILEVAAALIDWWDSHEDARTAWEAAKWLEQEVNR